MLAIASPLLSAENNLGWWAFGAGVVVLGMHSALVHDQSNRESQLRTDYQAELNRVREDKDAQLARERAQHAEQVVGLQEHFSKELVQLEIDALDATLQKDTLILEYAENDVEELVAALSRELAASAPRSSIPEAKGRRIRANIMLAAGDELSVGPMKYGRFGYDDPAQERIVPRGMFAVGYALENGDRVRFPSEDWDPDKGHTLDRAYDLAPFSVPPEYRLGAKRSKVVIATPIYESSPSGPRCVGVLSVDDSAKPTRKHPWGSLEKALDAANWIDRLRMALQKVAAAEIAVNKSKNQLDIARARHES